MTGEPVLTSSWCTNWGAFNTPRLWSMVAGEDDGPGRAQVSAWRTLAGSVRSQRAALLTARADLVAAWPPEENESAAAFVTELDDLIKRLDTASIDADTTASGLDNILNALQTAKTSIEPLWEQYRDKSDDLTPRWWDGAEDEIDEKARAAMITAERAVEDAVTQLKVPEKYELTIEGERKAIVDQGESRGRGSVGITASVPHDPVPPLPGQDATVPEDASGGDNPAVGDGSGSGVGDRSGSGGTRGSATAGAGGPDLAGVIAPGQPPVGPGLGGEPIGLPSGGGGGGGGGNPLVPGLLPTTTSGGGPIGRSGGRSPRGSARASIATTGEPTAGRGTSTGRGAPGGAGGGAGLGGARGGAGVGGARGGGGTGGRAAGRTAGRGSGRGAGRAGVPGVEAESVGGARGGSRSGGVPRPKWLPDDEAGPNRRAGVGTSPAGMPGAAGRANRRARGDDNTTGFDPDNPWQVAEGVDPVIAPSTDEPRHDPGPNVIGRHG
ncbi:hypothetical protein Adu01nite_07260 [Paractinoplanes durhamensis]|uniref:Uncharacterized protein n=1 Tax=Paractinoplanes durhamensis TaxID=113563 RepID=A0ABQ3YPB9_9ACTN|nr:hypothetical protein [Actinoplanes durhamensis]GID99375.1 hypothetical protein Adu01nite_07260 [Actinoplanes durhamensis]